MIQRKEIGKLICNYSAVASQRICYLLVPMALDSKDIESWAVRYGYNIVVIHGMDWDNDLTPWQAPGVLPRDKDFLGMSREFLQLLHERVIPTIEQSLSISPSTERTLIGISLSGLFAIWSWLESNDFTNICSISGSFWYDNFPEWVESKSMMEKNGCAYFSLGDMEGKNTNTRFCTVQEDTARVINSLHNSGIRTMFEQTSGTHFAPILPRIEKAFEGLEKMRKAE